MATMRDPFITDMGAQLEVKGDDGSFLLERFGAWVWDPHKGKHQVAEVSNDLKGLQAKYGVADDRVIPMKASEP